MHVIMTLHITGTTPTRKDILITVTREDIKDMWENGRLSIQISSEQDWHKVYNSMYDLGLRDDDSDAFIYYLDDFDEHDVRDRLNDYGACWIAIDYDADTQVAGSCHYWGGVDEENVFTTEQWLNWVGASLTPETNLDVEYV